MRYSLAISLASAAASLAGPLQTRQNKIPFFKADPGCGSVSQANHSYSDSEGCVGTLDYCSQQNYKSFGEDYNSPKDCLDARKPPPFIERNIKSADCINEYSAVTTIIKKKERCAGTFKFCNQKLYEGTIEMYDNPQQCINARQGVPELPTEAELCQSFNSNKEACIAARDTCVHDHKDKEAIIKCVHDAAVAAAAAKLPAAFQAKLCLLFHGNTEACETAIRVCWAKYEHDKRRMLWCVNAAVKQRTKTELCAKAKQPTEPKLAARADLPTEAELCSPFNGETNACKDATRECYEKDKHLMSSKKAIIKCVHAAAAAKRPTNEELCPPFNGNMEACTNARSYCTYKRKITREAMIKCVHDIAAKGPTDPAKEFDDSPIWSF